MRAINAAGLTLIKRFEGILDGNPKTVNLDPYLDPVGIWTIGWGHAIRGPNGKFLKETASKSQAYALYPDGLTMAQAEDLLKGDTLDAARDVSALAKVVLTENQFSALVSFAFNTGAGALGASTLLKKLNAGDYAGAAGQFDRWTKARDRNGVLAALPGLVRRREAERQLFVA